MKKRQAIEIVKSIIALEINDLEKAESLAKKIVLGLNFAHTEMNLNGSAITQEKLEEAIATAVDSGAKDEEK